jgi:hypothetical protein
MLTFQRGPTIRSARQGCQRNGWGAEETRLQMTAAQIFWLGARLTVPGGIRC